MQESTCKDHRDTTTWNVYRDFPMSERFRPIAEQYLRANLTSSQEWMCACPFCDGNNSLQFNVETGLWLCFRCSEKGNAETLVKKMGGRYTDPEVSVDTLRGALHRLRKGKNEDSELPVLPEQALLRYQFPHPYWEERGFDEETIGYWQLGYDPMRDVCTIPIRNLHGGLLGVIERRLDDSPNRYNYPKRFDRKASFFGQWDIYRNPTKRLALVEGSTDRINLWQAGIPALGQYGSFITEAQIRLLHRLGVKEVILFYDCDESGLKATNDALTKLTDIFATPVVWPARKYCPRTRICLCGNHKWYNIASCNYWRPCRCGRIHGMDPGKLSSREASKMFNDARRLT